MRISRNATRAGLVAILLVSAPALAFHDGGGSGSARCTGCLVATGVIAGVIDLAFIAVGIPMLAAGRAFHPAWSVIEMIWGLAQLLVGLIVTPLEAIGVGLGNSEAGPGLAVGIILIVVGVWLVTHGIINLKRYFTLSRPREMTALERLVPALAASAGPGGGTASLRWTF